MPDSLCVRCVHVRQVTSGRGSVFLLCGWAAVDNRYPKYPPQPTRECAAFASAATVSAALPPDAPGGSHANQ